MKNKLFNRTTFMNAIGPYRLGNWLYKKKIPLLPSLIRLYLFLVHGSRFPVEVEIGRGSYFIGKGLGLVFHPHIKIGQNCVIGQFVSIVGKTPYLNVARIGNNVKIGLGTTIIGPIIIEDNVVIGPNSVVTKSIAAGSVVAGNPARVIGHVEELGYSVFETKAYKEEFMPFLKINK